MKSATRDQLVAAGISLIPFAVMFLMSKPALRQAIKLRIVETARNVCVQQSAWWTDAAFTCARAYTRVKM